MSSHEEYSLAMLVAEQENDKKEKEREDSIMRAKESSIWCWRTQSCVLKKGHTSVCINDLGW